MKKFLSLLAALLCVCGMWAVAPTFEVTDMPSGNLDSINAIASAKGITITTSKGKFNGNSSGHWYVSCDSSATELNKGSFGIIATQKIDSISFLVSGNSATATAALVVCGWGGTPSTDLDYFYFDETNTFTTAKSYDNAVWITEKFDAYDLKAAYVYRQVSANVFNYDGSAVAKTGKGKTFNVFGVRVYLHEDTPSPVVANDTVFFVNKDSWTAVNCYAWTGNMTWPGESMTAAGYQLKNADVYYYVAAAGTYTSCIFNDGNSNQTADLSWTAGKYYYNGAWYTKAELESAEPEPEPTPAMESLIQFTETASAGALNGKTLGTGFTLTVTDTGSKIAVDGNVAMFGTSAADTIRFAYRMKTGGKSSASSCLSLVAPKDGKLTIYARTGSNSAIDRNVVVTNAEGTEIINHICLEADTLAERIDGNKVYLPISADITAGTYAITYPTSSINFYGFKLDTVVAPEPEPVATTDLYVMGIASWSASDAYKMTETVTGSQWTYDFGTTELVGKTFKIADKDWAIDLGSSEGLKEGTIAMTAKGSNIGVAGNYSSATNVVITLNKDANGNYTLTAAGTFVEGEAAIPDLYLRGINGAWTATDANKFAKDENSNTWTLTLDVTASDMFKVADANWGSYNFGSDGSTAVVPGTAYTLVNGGSNLWLQNTPTEGNYTFTVVKDGDNWTLTVTNNSATMLDQIQAAGQVSKAIVGGKLYIFKNGKMYNAAGMVVK